MTQITNEIFSSYFDCAYKSYLISKGTLGKEHDLTKYKNTRTRELKKLSLSDFKGKVLSNKFKTISFETLSRGYDYIHDAKFVTENADFNCDFLEKNKSKSNLGDFSYVPILVTPNFKNIPTKSKIHISGMVNILNMIQGGYLGFGKILYGNGNKTTIKSDNYIKEYLKAIKNISSTTVPDIIRNKNCNICQFNKLCLKTAQNSDNLSLLGGITNKKIESLNKKGIFTIKQLSYTFRPKRKSILKKQKIRVRSFELQALSIREDKIHIIGDPTVDIAKTKLFFDIEGIPERNCYYLFGLSIMVGKRIIEHQYFWINNKSNEKKVIEIFINKTLQYKESIIYHYGNYEIQALKKIQKDYPDLNNKLEEIILKCSNLLSLLYNNIYFPVYTNSLKEICGYLGYKWSHPKASGLQSIYWRLQWEKTGLPRHKETLIKYNQEDCFALSKLFKIIVSIIEDKTFKAKGKIIIAQEAHKIEKGNDYLFLVNATIIPEMKFVNKCSYFDYQKEKVFARLNKKLSKNIEKHKSEKKSHYLIKPDSIVEVNCGCPLCNSFHVENKKTLSKKIADLKFTTTGVHRNIVQYYSGEYICLECNHKFIPKDYPKSRIRIGHNLIVWAIYQNIELNMSFLKIESSLFEMFGLSISIATLFKCKKYFMDYYKETYNKLEKNVLSKNVIYADETPFSMQFEDGYAWVFTNNEEVVSFYKPNRDGGFLTEFLEDFNGVLVTDYYQVYDKINCSQQKCLIHLMRDLNSDLIRNPFNEEFKSITREFTELLQNIVLTIDEHGLIHVALKKHIPSAAKFINKIIELEFSTEVAIHYQTRIKKNKDKLFEFLKHDMVSWNNGNAEHAIRLLAIHANKNMTSFRASRIDDYLKFFSIYQTCDFKNISFLKFLLSKEKSIDGYIDKIHN